MSMAWRFAITNSDSDEQNPWSCKAYTVIKLLHTVIAQVLGKTIVISPKLPSVLSSYVKKSHKIGNENSVVKSNAKLHLISHCIAFLLKVLKIFALCIE